MKKIRIKKQAYILIAICMALSMCLILSNLEPFPENVEYIFLDREENATYQKYVENWLKARKSFTNLSKLGRILFLDEEEPPVTSKKTYRILVWKYGSTIEARHLRNFSNKTVDPFRHCPVNNCAVTHQDSALSTADLVIFHLHRMKGQRDLPLTKRRPEQIWAFLTDESPYHTFLSPKQNLSVFDGVFNWSMTYRSDSDIPVPYGRTLLKKTPENVQLNLKKRRDVLVAILGSNCGGKNHRWEYVRELQKHMQVDVYGKCGTLKTCPGHFEKDCPAIGDYLFYLSFENSDCDGYLTEKVWWNAYRKGAIPVVMGADAPTLARRLPPLSYVDVGEFAGPASMARFLLWLNDTGEYREYYRWKRYFEVANEHGYFGSESFHYCRACQALNHNDRRPKVYQRLEEFWAVRRDCRPPWDAR